MEKPMRRTYGTLKISSHQIDDEIKKIFFIFRFRWLLAVYPLGFYTSYLFTGELNFHLDFLLSGVMHGTILGAIFFISSYLIFKFQAKKKKKFLKEEQAQALKFENDLKEWRTQTLEAEPLYWKKYSGLEFEQAVFSLFGKIGWEVSRNFVTGDGGINIFGLNGMKKIKIICPQTQLKVGLSHLHNVLAIKFENDFDDIFVVASPIGFTRDSITLAKNNGIILLTPQSLSLLAEGNFNDYLKRLKVL